MRGKILPFFAAAFLLFAGWQWVQSQYPNFRGISEAQAIPQGMESITLPEVKQFINAGGVRIVFLYASWCPYCQKQMAGFKLFENEYNASQILAISTDNDPRQLQQYLDKQQSFPFTPYIYQGEAELMDFLTDAGASFSGGIPYFAVFKDGKYLTEFRGLTHPKELNPKQF